MSEIALRVGKRGEIYTTAEVRRRIGLREGGKARAWIEGRRLIIEAIPSIEDVIRAGIVELTPEEAERLSEEIQRERGIYG